MRDWQRSLLPIDLYQTALRFIVAIPIGYVFASLFKDDNAMFVAFGVGAVPILTLFSFVRQITGKRLEQFGTKPDEEITDDGITKLQGINNQIAQGFYREDIYTISQLANSDPIRLAMRTNRDFNFVIDCVSQALAWIYVNGKLNDLRLLGLRGAFEIRQYMIELDYSEPAPQPEKYESHVEYYEALRFHERTLADQALAKANLPLIAKTLGVKPSQVEAMFWGIAEDPYTEMLHNIWH